MLGNLIKKIDGCIQRHRKRKDLRFITDSITDLHPNDCGAINFWKDENGKKYVDIEWNDGLSAFDLDKVLDLIHKKKNSVTKKELVDYCL